MLLVWQGAGCVSCSGRGGLGSWCCCYCREVCVVVAVCAAAHGGVVCVMFVLCGGLLLDACLAASPHSLFLVFISVYVLFVIADDGPWCFRRFSV